MLKHISISHVWVLNQDEALDFYVNKLGLEVRADQNLGFMRWLTVGVPGDMGREILLELPGPPSVDGAAAEQIRELITKGATGFTVGFTTDDCQGTYEQLLRRIPSDRLKLVWDVGHALYGGIDPVEVVRSHPDRIAYLHLKDVDSRVLAELRQERLGFDDGIRRRVFTELGRGLLDVPALLTALHDIHYDGWLMVEQDSTWLAPAESARTSRAYLRGLGL